MFENSRAQTGLTTDFKAKADALEKSLEDKHTRLQNTRQIAELRPCVASTVHRALGSTFDIAIVDVADILTMRNQRGRCNACMLLLRAKKLI